MKRTNSRGLDFAVTKRRAGVPGSGAAAKQASAGPQTSSGLRGYGLSSGGLERAGSLGASGGSHGGAAAASSDGGGTAGARRAAAASRGQPEVCSPPAKPLNFLSPPVSPFAKAAAQAAAAEAAAAAAAAEDGSGSGRSAPPPCSSADEDSDWEEAMVLDNQENRRPCSLAGGSPRATAAAAAAFAAAAATWLSPVNRCRPHAAAASAPMPIPSPAPAGLPSPAMPTPAKEPGSLQQAPTLHHAPSFSSWMVSAVSRPPSPPTSMQPPPPQQQQQQQPRLVTAAEAGVAHVVADLEADPAAPRGFGIGGGGSSGSSGGGAGKPTHLDCLLAELGDTHYPASLLQWEREELSDSDAEQS